MGFVVPPPKGSKFLFGVGSKAWDELQGSDITFKEFKKKIKSLGYSYKTHVTGFGFGNPHRHLEVVDKSGNFICGSGANVYSQETIDKHRAVFDLLRKYRGRVFDEEGDKVLF